MFSVVEISFIDLTEAGVPVFDDVSFVGERDLARSVESQNLLSINTHRQSMMMLWTRMTSISIRSTPLTLSSSLPLPAPLHNFLLQLTVALFIFPVSLVAQFAYAFKKVIYVFRPIVIHGSRHPADCVQHEYWKLRPIDVYWWCSNAIPAARERRAEMGL